MQKEIMACVVYIRSLAAQRLGTPEPYATALDTLARDVSQLAGFHVATSFANMWQVMPVEMSYGVAVPYWWLNRGDYAVRAEMYAVDGARMTGLEGRVWVDGEADEGGVQA